MVNDGLITFTLEWTIFPRITILNWKAFLETTWANRISDYPPGVLTSFNVFLSSTETGWKKERFQSGTIITHDVTSTFEYYDQIIQAGAWFQPTLDIFHYLSSNNKVRSHVFTFVGPGTTRIYCFDQRGLKTKADYSIWSRNNYSNFQQTLPLFFTCRSGIS